MRSKTLCRWRRAQYKELTIGTHHVGTQGRFCPTCGIIRIFSQWCVCQYVNVCQLHKGITTGNEKLLGAPGLTTVLGARTLLGAPGIATKSILTTSVNCTLQIGRVNTRWTLTPSDHLIPRTQARPRGPPDAQAGHYLHQEARRPIDRRGVCAGADRDRVSMSMSRPNGLSLGVSLGVSRCVVSFFTYAPSNQGGFLTTEGALVLVSHRIT